MPRYRNTPILRSRNIRNGSQYFRGTKYPEVPLSPDDIYVVTTEGDKLDVLAQQFYGDKNLWWVISIANVGLAQNSLYIPIGTQLRLPANVQDIISNYNELNNR